VFQILSRQEILVGEADQQKVDLRPGGHLLEHGHEVVDIDPTPLLGALHRIKLLNIPNHR